AEETSTASGSILTLGAHYLAVGYLRYLIHSPNSRYLPTLA
ncbi:hypothetical protein JMJ77_0005989, partial [Colletotrichum scovillei]